MCKFNIRFEGRPVAVMEQTASTIIDGGGSFTIDGDLAHFSVATPVGRVDGECLMADPSMITITITKKPFWVPCSAIKDRIVAAFVAANRSSTAANRLENERSEGAQNNE